MTNRAFFVAHTKPVALSTVFLPNRVPFDTPDRLRAGWEEMNLMVYNKAAWNRGMGGWVSMSCTALSAACETNSPLDTCVRACTVCV